MGGSGDLTTWCKSRRLDRALPPSLLPLLARLSGTSQDGWIPFSWRRTGDDDHPLGRRHRGVVLLRSHIPRRRQCVLVPPHTVCLAPPHAAPDNFDVDRPRWLAGTASAGVTGANESLLPPHVADSHRAADPAIGVNRNWSGCRDLNPGPLDRQYPPLNGVHSLSDPSQGREVSAARRWWEYPASQLALVRFRGLLVGQL